MQEPTTPAHPPEAHGRTRGLFPRRSVPTAPPADTPRETFRGSIELLLDERLDDGMRAIEEQAAALMREIASEMWRASGSGRPARAGADHLPALARPGDPQPDRVQRRAVPDPRRAHRPPRGLPGRDRRIQPRDAGIARGERARGARGRELADAAGRRGRTRSARGGRPADRRDDEPARRARAVVGRRHPAADRVARRSHHAGDHPHRRGDAGIRAGRRRGHGTARAAGGRADPTRSAGWTTRRSSASARPCGPRSRRPSPDRSIRSSSGSVCRGGRYGRRRWRYETRWSSGCTASRSSCDRTRRRSAP